MTNRIKQHLLSALHVVPLLICFCPAWQGCGTLPTDQARTALADEDYNLAIQILSDEIKSKPDSTSINFLLGKAYFLMGKAQAEDPNMGGNPGSAFYDGEQYFRKALALDPGHFEARLLLASALYMNNNLEEAMEHGEICLQENGEDTQALQMAGLIGIGLYAQAGEGADSADLDLVISRLKKALAVDPSLAAAHLRLSDAYLYKADIPAALEALKQGIQACPGHNPLHERLLNFNGMEQGITPREAVTFYRTEIETRSAGLAMEGHATLCWFLAVWHCNLGSLHYGKEEFSLAAKEYSLFRDYMIQCAQIYPAFQAASDEQVSLAHLNRGWCHLKLENFDEAEADFFASMAVDPEAPNKVFAIDSLGYAISQSRGMEGGLAFFKRLTAFYGERHQWWNDYGFFSLETNMASDEPPAKYEKTLAIYARALELEPDFPRYVNDSAMLINYYLDPEGKRKEEVEAMFKKAWTLGKEAYENPFTDEGEKAVHFSAYTDALVNLGRFYLMENRLDRSKLMVEELLPVAPDRFEVILLQRVLAGDLPPERVILFKKALAGSEMTEVEMKNLQQSLREQSRNQE